MRHTQRIIGVDVGLKRIGIARSDINHVLATPMGAFSQKEALEQISNFCESGEVCLIVVGWPLTLRGDEGESVKMVQNFIDKLEKRIGSIPIKICDERFTSSLARQSIRDSGAKRKKRSQKDLVDATAAAILLQSYLDQK